jgi:23S rRNA (cytosine1962-C5)-methyltransferase
MPRPPDRPSRRPPGKAQKPVGPTRAEPLVWLDQQTIRQLHETGTDAFRIADSQALRIECFGTACLISGFGDHLPTGLVESIHARMPGKLTAIYERKLVRGPGLENAPVLLWGDPGPDHKFPAREAGITYEVDFSVGYSCGLFLDQRTNRARVGALAPARLLNLFCFTGSFSVCAAMEGGHTTNVDLSKLTLTRARRNFEVNGLGLEGHKFFADDVFDVLPRLVRRGGKFDVIVLDPPTFSRGRGGRIFRAGEDLVRLANQAAACATNGGWILISTNCSTISLADLQSMVRREIPAARELTVPDPLPDFPCGTGSTTLWFRVCAA